VPIHGDGGGGGTHDGRRPECTHTNMYACVRGWEKGQREHTQASLRFALAKLIRSLDG
jgi:hypothetical protein